MVYIIYSGRQRSMMSRQRKQKRWWLRIVLGVGVVVILVLVGVAVRYVSSYNNFLDKISRGNLPAEEYAEMEIGEVEVKKEPFAVLISGSDSRVGIEDATARSDVNIVAVVNPVESKILLVSIPRDTYVQLHGTTGLRDKLTHAGIYGINISKTTIEDFLGIKIDHTIKVSFDTVVRVVDQLDGVEIDSDKAMSLSVEGKDKKCNYVEGRQVVDGDCALRFSRERKSYETGDRHRGENQMQVLTAIIEKMTGAQNYILRLPAILDIAADSFETTFARSEIEGFIGLQLTEHPAWEVKSISVDGVGAMLPTYSMGENRPLYVMLADEESVAEVKRQIGTYLANAEGTDGSEASVADARK